MTSQLMVKINVTPFSQVNKTKSSVNGELIAMSRASDEVHRVFEKNPENVRIGQLEQNIKFLQDQHQIMLGELHAEIEQLRNKNRELQFQLIFDKNQQNTSQTSSSSTSSDEEHKIFSSPGQPPFTPSLHVELLERMIGDMKIQQQETDSRNVYLSAIVDEQKKKLERYERDRERERERTAQTEPELRRKVEDADAIIRRLQQENNALRKDCAAATAAAASSSASPMHYHQREPFSHRENNGHQQQQHHQKGSRGNRRNNSMNYRSNWFPPLNSQNYWPGGGGSGNRGGHHDKRNNPRMENSLPNVNTGGGGGGGGGQQHNQSRRGNNNHNHDGELVRHKNNHKGVDRS